MPGSDGAYSTFSLLDRVTKKSPVHGWVCNALIHELPASVHTVLHVNDRASARVAKWIGEETGGEVVIACIGSTDAMTLVGDGGSVVVVAYQDGPGLERIRSANMALRNLEGRHRHFVLCYAFPFSGAEYRRLKADVRMGRRSSEFGWSEFLALPVGNAVLHESLVGDGAGYSGRVLEAHRADLGDELADSLLARLGQGEIPSDGLFLPRVDGRPLCLRPGSVFFHTQSQSLVSQIAVYAMVSAALQKAREPDAKDRSAVPAFDENPLVRSVLDPRMFARFNDGVLQASLLRGSQPSELDYRSSDDLSRGFAAVCQSVLEACDQDVGDAALEFVNALVTRKVALRSTDRDRLLEKVRSNPVLQSIWRLLEADQEPFGSSPNDGPAV